ncbi:MAG: DNA replication and repair protein RecF [Muribaculaceae bacterium]|nr:DNA replication and repair protein RecF [Muribaculaceae bacterium]
MVLNEIAITNFKNIADARLEFSQKVNCFLGNNGMGKSNLLDAIYYLSFCKSFSGLPDGSLIRRGEDFMTLRGAYLRRGVAEELTMGLMPGKRKSFKRRGKEYERLSAHIGAFPLVMVAPADQELISGTGEERRRFMDQVIAQSDPIYLDHLIRYGKALMQRNKLLRDHVVDPNLYLAVEMAMERSAAYLQRARARWVEELTVIFERYYSGIAADGEIPSVGLRSHLSADPDGLVRLLDGTRRHDEAVGHTSVGPHRDDIELQLCGMPVRRAASQGQCKTYTIALRLAQYEFLRQAAGMKPLLLLDDIFDKLDATRVERLVEMVSSDLFGQIFITDTNRDHLDSIISRSASGGGHRSWKVEAGAFTLISAD